MADKMDKVKKSDMPNWADRLPQTVSPVGPVKPT